MKDPLRSRGVVSEPRVVEPRAAAKLDRVELAPSPNWLKDAGTRASAEVDALALAREAIERCLKVADQRAAERDAALARVAELEEGLRVILAVVSPPPLAATEFDAERIARALLAPKEPSA